MHGTLQNVIEIPGYRLLRQLGRGGMATVYLAVQESVDREVALKVMSPALLVDPNFGERFMREAKIAARLHHRHVVGIHDVGRVGDYHYIAMEYLPAGPVLSKDGQPRAVPFALRVIREIATAINYAQEKGFIHRDIKPDNILLRDDGSAALTDFGIARANDSSTRMTRTGAVVGTPHYMSPEQARGKQIDGRSDLYSLGVVLYEMLVGRVPYHAEDSLAVGIMHITQPVPTLPDELAVLQPLVDNLLAKEPEQRFQTGNEAAAAITRYEQAISNGELPDLAGEPQGFQRDARSQETRVSPLASPAVPSRSSPRPSSTDATSRQRSEPSIGRLDEIMAATDQHIMRASRAGQRRGPAPPRRRTGLFAVIFATLVLVAVGAAAWVNQDSLRALLPSTELNDVLAQAQRALDAGDLGGTTGGSARELFQKARALDPDNDIARRGLSEVGRRQLVQAREALARRDLESARRLLGEARELLGGGIEVDAIARDLASNETRGEEIEALLGAANAALAGGRLLGDEGAIAGYRRVLAAEPDNALARSGIAKVVEALARQAGAALDADEATAASVHIENIARVMPAYPGLPDLRARLSRQREAAMTALEQDLVRAEAQLRSGRVSATADSAQALFESVLARDAGNERARAGLRRVAAALITQANATLDDRNPGATDRLLRQAEELAPDLPELRTAKVALRELRERLEIAASRRALTPADTERVQKLVAEAAQAVANGRLIEPPGNCAYDKYRAALAIDGSNAAALDGMNRLPARARELFETSIAEGALGRARAMIDAVRQLAPADASVPTMTERLVVVHLDQADARIAAQEREQATRALESARQLNPGHPRIAPTEQKLRAMPAAAGDA